MNSTSQLFKSVSYEKIDNILPQTTVFLHGNLASNRWWYPTEEVFRTQNKTKNLAGSMIMVEFRGCGKSPAPASQADVDMHLFANNFIEMIESMNLGPVNLVGHSTGGLIAALMLAKAPTLFNKAVLLDPVGAKGVKFEDSMTDAFEAMKTNKELVAMVMASTIFECKQDTDFFKQIVVEDAFHAVGTVGAGVLKALDGFDARAEIATVKHPVLVLHGEHDLLLPIKDSQDMAALMKSAKFEVIKGQGHCCNVENTAHFAGILNSFLFV